MKWSGQVSFFEHTRRRMNNEARMMKNAFKKGWVHFQPLYTTGPGKDGELGFKFKLLKKTALTAEEKNLRNRQKRYRKIKWVMNE